MSVQKQLACLAIFVVFVMASVFQVTAARTCVEALCRFRAAGRAHPRESFEFCMEGCR